MTTMSTVLSLRVGNADSEDDVRVDALVRRRRDGRDDDPLLDEGRLLRKKKKNMKKTMKRESMVIGPLPAATTRKEELEGLTTLPSSVPSSVPSFVPSAVPSVAPTATTGEGDSLYDLLASTSELSHLLDMVDATTDRVSNLAFLLRQEEFSMTLFAPSNDAIDDFLRDEYENGTAVVLADAIRSAEATKLLGLFLHHLLFNRTILEDDLLNLPNGTELETYIGIGVVLTNDSGSVLLDGRASIVTPDRTASNGVLHVIDAVLKPEIGSMLP